MPESAALVRELHRVARVDDFLAERHQRDRHHLEVRDSHYDDSLHLEPTVRALSLEFQHAAQDIRLLGEHAV